jgi:hypothetical protein
MSTLAEIRTKVQRRLVDITAGITAETDDLINSAIREAEETYNFRIMQASTELVTTLATRRLPASSTSIPTDWKESRAKPYLREGQDGELGTQNIQWAPSLEEMVLLYSLDDPNDKGQPQFILEDFAADEFSVFPFPDGASLWTDGEYRVTIPYWKFLPALVDDGDTNWFTNNMTNFVTEWAIAEGFLLNWDEERAGVWLTKAQVNFNRGKKFDKRAKLPRDLTLNLKRDVFAPSHTRR